MNDRKDVERVQLALDATFSNLKDDPWLAQKVLANAKGEVKVKKKLSLGLILVIVLVLAAVTALAAALLWEQQVVPMKEIEQESGYYEHWTIGQKQALIQALLDSGNIKEDADTARLFDDATDEVQKHAIADGLMLALTGQTDVEEISVDGITYAIMGPEDRWTPEQRVWWQQVTNQFYGTQGSADTWVMPSSDVISQEDAVAIAKAVMLESGLLSQEVLDKALPVANLYVTEQRPDYRRWDIQFKVFREGSDTYVERVYAAVVDEDGVVIADPDVSMPSVQEMAENRAVAGQSAIMEAVEQYRVRAGNVIFPLWPLALKAEFSANVAPQVRQIVDGGDLTALNSGGEPDLDVIAFSSYTYGLPGEKDIDQEAALPLARDALKTNFQLDDDTIALYDVPYVYFDVTDADKPLWKIVFCASYASAEKFPSGFSSGQGHLRYKVEINAQTAEVASVKEFDFDAMGGDLSYKLMLY